MISFINTTYDQKPQFSVQTNQFNMIGWRDLKQWDEKMEMMLLNDTQQETTS
jgi:hypothetical protein